ncbi:ABC transporter permease [Spongiactinospora gelatinilytica]|uniref:ABC transporter permease n=1 Tax=Spongiactinospora gelatinilytica TaxID=2666298 RepID=A0A2W2FT40_9ACTN|nr:ABC transporter permease [Spongiactinospora gelatinilytica]PZG38883.1 ABC transporter permease [Spongiactinospora gelatinilytica]
MTRILVRRLLLSVPLLFVVSIVVFVLQSLIPGDAASQLAGLQATQEDVQRLRRQLNLDEPIWTQYWHWLDGVFHGSLGTSLTNKEAVTTALGTRLPVTLSLVLGATLLATVLGVVLGVISGKAGPLAERLVDLLSIAGLAVPSFWLGLLLIALVSVRLGLLPATGYVRFADSPSGWAQSLLLPVVALGLAGVTAIAKQTREAMLDVLRRPYIDNLRANGVPERRIVFRHALRGAAIPICTMSSILLVGALGGSIVIEQVFGLPGLGGLAVSATGSKDIPVIQGVAVYFTLLVVAANLLTDIAYLLIDPRVRAS